MCLFFRRLAPLKNTRLIYARRRSISLYLSRTCTYTHRYFFFHFLFFHVIRCFNFFILLFHFRSLVSSARDIHVALFEYWLFFLLLIPIHIIASLRLSFATTWCRRFWTWCLPWPRSPKAPSRRRKIALLFVYVHAHKCSPHTHIHCIYNTCMCTCPFTLCILPHNNKNLNFYCYHILTI